MTVPTLLPETPPQPAGLVQLALFPDMLPPEKQEGAKPREEPEPAAVPTVLHVQQLPLLAEESFSPTLE